MTIREVLNADWTVDQINVTVRNNQTTEFITGYHIGENVRPGKYFTFEKETKAGDVYVNGDQQTKMKHLYCEKIIQHKHLPNVKKGMEGCVGIVEKNIPNEILDLEIEHMAPTKLGSSDGMHGYAFDCYVPIWFGIPGENELMERD